MWKVRFDPNFLENNCTLDPTLFVTAHKSKRFYLFTQRELDGEAYERDIFNEKPTKEESVAAAQVEFLHMTRIATKILSDCAGEKISDKSLSQNFNGRYLH